MNLPLTAPALRETRPRVAVIGAGPGGLASAMMLAAAGARVTLYERDDVVGGRTRTLTAPGGYRFDLGPTFFLYPRILSEIFAACGASLEQEVELRQLDPQYRLVFEGSESIDATPDMDRMEAEIARLSPGDARGLRPFLAENRRKLEAFRPVLERALPRQGGPKVVYSSQNIEWSARPTLFSIGLKRPGGDQLVEATRLLEAGFARRADLVLSISDLEGNLIAAESGRPVHYVPPVSDLALGGPPAHRAYAQAAREARCRYAALMGSAYWPNVEGFFTAFPESLGFLAQDEQVWVAGSLGPALQDDPRYGDYKSVNDARLRAWGYVPDGDKPAFFAGASCVIVPVSSGAGAKLKTADALASGLPVVITPHALEGYGPLVQDALGQGVYVADTPQAFRGLVRQAMREGLPGCAPEVRRRLGFDRMADTLRPLYEGLLDGAA